ncbi:PleD family two-component system response regulator [Mariniblastus fucicola]|uniref:Response regulator PleD n=1 Tax=Mariniblastus fucicola TaxID=980251 RepID=A0A5B9P9G3_9BACT|nr:response regulator [Mariniblastus fucicola]QEG21540.1 response regulator PleD [Mariniblastus fucicola]
MTTVLDIGNCNADHFFITTMLKSNFDANVLRAHGADDALTTLEENEVDLIMINRLLDVDHSEGMDVFRKIKSNPKFESIPAMLITNFDDHQKAAMEEGAVQGFGKSALTSDSVVAVVKDALSSS